MPTHAIFGGMDDLASGMRAERRRSEVAAQNLANAGSTRPLDNGLPYARQRVLFEAEMDRLGRPQGGVRSEVVDSPRYTQRYDPDHPHADPATGMVTESDIDPILELTDLMLANKAYAANVNAVRGMHRMHEQALRIGER